MTSPGIFISYRRTDSRSQAQSIYERLTREGHKVFLDHDEIHPGDTWRQRITRALAGADVVLALIGPRWLTAHDSDGRRRIDDTDDTLRQELQLAFNDGKKVIPVLINGASMPATRSLPEALSWLSGLQAKTLTDANWSDDMTSLVRELSGGSLTDGPGLPQATVVLASTSPRRQDLLRTVGWHKDVDYFAIQASVRLDGNRRIGTLEDARRVAESMAKKKIQWLYANPPALSDGLPDGTSPQTVLVGVDTIVFCRGWILDRPLARELAGAGPQELETASRLALDMLKEQRGQEIHIITGLAVATLRDHNSPGLGTVVTRAKLREYSQDDIQSYVRKAKPLDKAGAFGIQEQGVALFESIDGSYSNIVGLPLREFIALLERRYGSRFTFPGLSSSLPSPSAADSVEEGIAQGRELSAVCIGDINYDLIVDELSSEKLANLAAPGEKVYGTIRRTVGGTAVNFAKGARRAGFSSCYAVGVIGGDAIGNAIRQELEEYKIVPITISLDPGTTSSVAVIVRDTNDMALTLIDAQHQSLPDKLVRHAQSYVPDSSVVYCSGYCLVDRNRRDGAVKLMETARAADCLVVLDVVVDMSKTVPLSDLTGLLWGDGKPPLVDVAVAEMPDIFRWYDIGPSVDDEIAAWEQYKDGLIDWLRSLFPVTILRSHRYTHEIVITPDSVSGPSLLDYAKRGADEKTGYGDFRTGEQIHRFMSPRILLASGSPQRRDLLGQIVAPSKVQVLVSGRPEEHIDGEAPEQRVMRLAKEKAEAVLDGGQFHDDIELIIGADTEIVLIEGDDGQLVGHPRDEGEALDHLKLLNNRSHVAMTGVAVIGRDPASKGKLKEYVTCVKTTVTFIDASEEQLRDYAATHEPIGRAGAYAIQGAGSMLIKGVSGSYSNVVGLPLEHLAQVFDTEFGKPIWRFDKVSDWSLPDPIKGCHW